MTSTLKTIRTARLGANGPLVGAQGLGTMVMATGVYGDTDEMEAMATLERALEGGVTLFDTADMYGDGRGEEFVGSFVRRHRDDVVLATKFAFVLKEGTQYDFSISNRPDYIRSAGRLHRRDGRSGRCRQASASWTVRSVGRGVA